MLPPCCVTCCSHVIFKPSQLSLFTVFTTVCSSDCSQPRILCCSCATHLQKGRCGWGVGVKIKQIIRLLIWFHLTLNSLLFTLFESSESNKKQFVCAYFSTCFIFVCVLTVGGGFPQKGMCSSRGDAAILFSLNQRDKQPHGGVGVCPPGV